MPKRKTKESSDSANKTSTESDRVFQHGAVTRIEAKQVNKSNDKALKSISKKPIVEITNAKTNTTKKRTKPQTQSNGQYWKDLSSSKTKAKAKTKESIVNETSSEESNDESTSVEDEAEVNQMSQSEITQTESETEEENPKKRVKFQRNKNDIDNTKYADLEQRFQLQFEKQKQFQQLQQQHQQQQFLVLKDLLYQERDKVREYETVIERQKWKLDEQASQPGSSKQTSVYESFMSRKIPEFNGTDGEDEFESWKLRIKEFLKQPIFNHYNEDRKISTIKLGVCGTAAMVLEADSRNIHTTNDLIEVLGKVYGVDKKSSECRAMQLEKESIRQYHARLKAYLVASGMIQGTDNFNNWMLKSFMEGVKPEIKVKLQAALPYDIEEAFRKAQTAEVWLLSQKVKKAETKALTFGEVEVNNSEETVANINNNNNNNINGNESNSRSGFIGGNKNASNNNNNNTNSNNNYEQQRYINVQCFGCNKAGHRFSQCWSIDDV